MIILILHQFPAFNSVRLLLSPSNYFLSTDFHNCKVFSVPQIFSWILAHILGFLYSQTISSISIICCCIFPHPPPLPPLLFSSWGWTGRSVVLRFMGLQTVGYDWATELNWTSFYYLWCNGPSLSHFWWHYVAFWKAVWLMQRKIIFNIMALKPQNSVHTPAATVQNIYMLKDN